jgi:predicted PolB exonuclease-like 3'-5' exonuclease
MKPLFFDIETAGIAKDFDSLTPEMQDAWLVTTQYLNSKDYAQECSLIPEFGQVVCCTFAYENKEKELIVITKTDIIEIWKIFEHSYSFTPCGWNIKGFDIPFLNKHFLKNGLKIPNILSLWDPKVEEIKKPWLVKVLDMQEIWKQNGFNSCKFNSACVFLGIESPKNDIDGSQVHETFWNGEIERIKKYCEKDVISLHKMYNKIIHLL